jgi:ABC-2 type transport system permease protein
MDNTSAAVRSGFRLWMRFLHGTAAICVWEIRTFFFRPASWMLLLAAALLAAWGFSWLVTLLARGADPALRSGDDPILQFLGPNVFLIGACTLLVPLLTMNAIADERRRGSWELLVTAPVPSLAVVVGKFAAIWYLLMTSLAPWFYYIVVLGAWNGRTKLLWSFLPWLDGRGVAFDWGQVFASGIGLGTVGATFVAVGLLCSSLCRGPASAALLSLVAMATILLAGVVPRVLDYWSFPAEQIRLVETISCWSHVQRFNRGILEPEIIAGHVSLCTVLLWGTAVVARRVDNAA